VFKKVNAKLSTIFSKMINTAILNNYATVWKCIQLQEGNGQDTKLFSEFQCKYINILA